jgi:hypothetical protein
MTKNPIEEPDFQRTLQNLLGMKPKPHSEMRIGKKVKAKKKSARKTKTR